MIIDARGLSQSIKSGAPITKVSSAEAQRASKLLSKIDWNIPPAEDEEMAPLSGGASRAGARKDTLDLSTTGLKNIKRVELDCVYEMDYTKEKAVQNAWFNSQNTIFKLMGSGSVISDEAVVGMDKGEFAEYMKTHELDKTINWGSVKINLQACVSYGNFKDYTDYAAALFAGLEDRIKTDFEGGEQAEQLGKLNEIYEDTVNKLVNAFKADTASFGLLGVPLPEGKLEESVRAVMASKREAYSGYIKKHEDYANIMNGEDNWLRRDECFMANALRNAYKPSGGSRSDDLWSQDELTALGMMSTLVGHEARYKDVPLMIGKGDEESVGLSISLQWLKKERITDDYDISGDTKRLFNDLFSSCANTVIDATNRSNALMKKDPVRHYASASSKLSISAVNDVLRVMQESYAKIGNAKTAIRETAKFAHDTYIKKAKMPFIWGTYSLHGGSGSDKYWESFYDDGSGSTGKSGMSAILKSWDSFSEIMDSRDTRLFYKNMGAFVLSV